MNKIVLACEDHRAVEDTDGHRHNKQKLISPASGDGVESRGHRVKGNGVWPGSQAELCSRHGI